MPTRRAEWDIYAKCDLLHSYPKPAECGSLSDTCVIKMDTHCGAFDQTASPFVYVNLSRGSGILTLLTNTQKSNAAMLGTYTVAASNCFLTRPNLSKRAGLE